MTDARSESELPKGSHELADDDAAVEVNLADPVKEPSAGATEASATEASAAGDELGAMGELKLAGPANPTAGLTLHPAMKLAAGEAPKEVGASIEEGATEAEAPATKSSGGLLGASRVDPEAERKREAIEKRRSAPPPNSLAAPSPESPAATSESPSASRSRPRAASALPLLLLPAGALLLAAPKFLPQLAAALESFGGAGAWGTLCALAGVVLYALSSLRAHLSNVMSHVQKVASDTGRLEHLEHDGMELRGVIEGMSTFNVALKTDVDALRAELAELTHLANDPSQQSSMFRLAASLDQLGARLDKSLSGHFGKLSESVDQLTITEQDARQRAAQDLELVEGKLVAEFSARTQALATAISDLCESSADGDARLAHRLEALQQELPTRLEAQEQTLGASLAQLATALQEARAETASGLESVSGAVRGTLDQRSAELEAALKDLAHAQREGRAAHDQATAGLLEQVHEVAASQAQHARDLQQGLREFAADAELARESERTERGEWMARWESESAAQRGEIGQNLASLAERMREQSGALEERLQAWIGDVNTALEAQSTSDGERVQALEAHLDAHLEERFEATRTAVEQLEGALNEAQAHSNERLRSEFESLAARLGRVDADLSERISQQAQSAQRGMEELAQRLSTWSGELRDSQATELSGLRGSLTDLTAHLAAHESARVEDDRSQREHLAERLAENQASVRRAFVEAAGPVAKALSDIEERVSRLSSLCEALHDEQHKQAAATLESFGARDQHVEALGRTLHAQLDGLRSALEGAVQAALERAAPQVDVQGAVTEFESTARQHYELLSNDLMGVAEIAAECAAKVDALSSELILARATASPVALDEVDAPANEEKVQLAFEHGDAHEANDALPEPPAALPHAREPQPEDEARQAAHAPRQGEWNDPPFGYNVHEGNGPRPDNDLFDFR